ncbi:MAG: SDR family oxidoreductase [Bacteroidales bacterium]|nr:SDR family oxidoreductase [Bacteroidales bacterium]
MNQKTAIITGGAQGIGRITALSFFKKGYKTVVLDLDTEAIEDLKKNRDYSGIHFFHCDVSVEDDISRSISQIAEWSDGIHIVVNNAAIAINKPVELLSLDEWNKVMGVNLTGAFLCSKHASQHLKRTKGSIINISSTRAFMSEPDTEAYSASKGGIISLTHALAISLGPEVRVNCISPGWIDVSMHKKTSGIKEPALTDADHSQHPAGRVGQASDIVNTIFFLTDEKNSFITGQNFIVDGGMTRKMIYV